MENREIKFRAWNKKDKIMYQNIQKGFEFTDLSHYTFNEFLGYPDGMGDCHEWEVMQYTGLKDKNGKEIYEGDILKWRARGEAENEKVIAYVYWINSESCFCVGDEDAEDGYCIGDVGRYAEIIGNIFKNPNLIKKNKN